LDAAKATGRIVPEKHPGIGRAYNRVIAYVPGCRSQQQPGALRLAKDGRCKPLDQTKAVAALMLSTSARSAKAADTASSFMVTLPKPE
jgi:hypothetical protein